MRLFGEVDSAIDRMDRAEWISPPFDLMFTGYALGPFAIVATEVHQSGAVIAEIHQSGAVAMEVYTPGAVISEVAS